VACTGIFIPVVADGLIKSRRLTLAVVNPKPFLNACGFIVIVFRFFVQGVLTGKDRMAGLNFHPA
jgi:hypothetical protein